MSAAGAGVTYADHHRFTATVLEQVTHRVVVFIDNPADVAVAVHDWIERGRRYGEHGHRWTIEHSADVDRTVTVEHVEPTSPDNCPTCGRRIVDTDDNGCEADNGQRWCRDHRPPDWNRETRDHAET